jgi:hypothetical protein
MLWGKSFWTTIHVAALGFPEVATDEARQKYKAFYTSIGDVLPCAKCKANYARHFNKLPIDFYLFDKNMLFTWTVQLHNIVNAEIKKKELSVEDAKEYYVKGTYAKTPTTSDMGTLDSTKGKQIVDVLILLNAVMLIILVILFAYRFLKK